MGGIDNYKVTPGSQEGIDPHLPVLCNPYGSGNPKPSQLVFAGSGVFSHLLDILYGNETLQIEIPVNYKELFNLMLVEDLL